MTAPLAAAPAAEAIHKPPRSPGEKPSLVGLSRAGIGAELAAIGVEPKQIHIRPMKRKWASCSSQGRLTFDESLLRQSAAFRREVIVHELLHLKVPNHGPVFRSLLRAYLSD